MNLKVEIIKQSKNQVFFFFNDEFRGYLRLFQIRDELIKHALKWKVAKGFKIAFVYFQK